jgi:tetratricopeptide (TPR) repeat protein
MTGPRRQLVVVASLVLLLAGFAALCHRYDVVQDDAYISLVYARHLATGDGLVFNPGERVEGYTNFLWTVALAVPHLLGIDAAATARGLGWLAAAGLIIVSRRLASVFGRRRAWHWGAPMLLAANGSLAFWGGSGLETGAFALLVAIAAGRYLRRGRLDAAGGCLFGIAALTRPEGWLFFALTGLHQAAATVVRRQPRRRVLDLWPAAATFAAFVLPHLLFRLVYYGYALPNTFHAKTGISLTYVHHGLRYTAEFLVDYGFWGLAPLSLALLTSRARTRPAATYLALLVFANATYVTLVGGDTLPEHRLYLPVVALLNVGVVEAVRAASLRLLGRHRAPLAGAALLLAMAARTATGADDDLLHARDATRAHNDKLRDLAAYVNDRGDLDLVASTAIGIPRYFTAAAVLDLVGLTDETIAHDPQSLPGIRDDHLLRNYHVSYVLDRRPDAVLFIGGERPTTPAERALFLSSRFRRRYFTGFVEDRRPLFLRRSGAGVADGPDDPFADGAFVEAYSEALAVSQTDPDRAVQLLRRCLEMAPSDFAAPHARIGRLLYAQGQIDDAERSFRQAVAIDDHLVMASAHLALIEMSQARPEDALARARRAVELAPRSHFCRYVLGRSQLATDRPVAALTTLARAVELPGTLTIDALYWYGVACERADRPEAARAAFAGVLRLEPENQVARRALESLTAP